MITGGDWRGCWNCGAVDTICPNCEQCKGCCDCQFQLFDADELGLDPETDNTPYAGSRHA